MDHIHKNILIKIAKELNQSKVTWAIGASMMLKLRDFDMNVHDIDIMVNQDDFELACTCLNNLGNEIVVEESKLFKTKYFKRYNCDGIEIDIMSGMGIIHKSGFFDYQFKFEDIEKELIIDTINLPLCYVEDWYIFYHLMPNRYETIQKIHDYFNNHQFNTQRFKKLLNLEIPYPIQLLLTELIENENIKF